MQLFEFLSRLSQNPPLEVVFDFPSGSIRKDYHLTEVLRVQVHAMDCGGETARWSETVLQLVEPSHEDGSRFMQSDKALAILARSNERIALDVNSEVLLEFKPTGSAAAQRFHIEDVQVDQGQLWVNTRGSTTRCKAADRSLTVCGAKTQAAACCTPADPTRSGLASPEQSRTTCCA